MFVTLYMYMYVVLDAHVDVYNVHAVTVYIPVGLQCDIQRQEITNSMEEGTLLLSLSHSPPHDHLTVQTYLFRSESEVMNTVGPL